MNDPHVEEELIFEAARRLKPPHRQAYLDCRTGNDPELKARVEKLLQASKQADTFFESGARWLAQSALLFRIAEQPGDRISHYRLVRQIGEGGSSLVYLAEQDTPVKRQVALKIIKLGMDTPSVIARFNAERQALAMMDHSHIARVLDGGATETGRPFFVMELVSGVKITEYCDEHALSLADRLKLFLKVCQAVQHAHQKGVIHRDLKPSNILVTNADGELSPKVIDFGIAKAIRGRLAEQTIFTAIEQLLGTPGYMSPEQTGLSSVDVDTRSDIYSLGVLLYELLTGRTPFDSQELLASGLEEMRRTIREREPVRPSQRLKQLDQAQLAAAAGRTGLDAPRLIPTLRGDLDWIVMKCLEKVPARRYATAGALADDLERFLQHQPVTARPPDNFYYLVRFVRRNKLPVTAGALLLATILLTTAISIRSAILSRNAKRVETQLRLEAVASEQIRKKLQFEAESRANEARAAEGMLKEKLWASYLAQAQAGRFSRKPGARFTGLKLLKLAAAIRPSLDLRNEAIACLALPDLRLTRKFKAAPGLNGIISFEAGSNRYAMGGEDGLVRVLNLETADELARLPGPGRIHSIYFSPNPDRLGISYYQDNDLSLLFWSIAGQKIAFDPGIRGFRALDFFGTNLAAVAVKYGPIHILDCHTRQWLRSFPQTSLLNVIAFDPGGTRLATSGVLDGVLIRDSTTGAILQKLEHPDVTFGLRWNADGSLLVTGAADGRIRIWDVARGKIRSTLSGHQSAVLSMQFNHREDLLVSTSWDGRLRFWNALSGTEICSQAGFSQHVVFGPDDQWLLARDYGPMTDPLEVSELGLFELASGRECQLLHLEAQEPWQSVFSRDGAMLITPHQAGVSFSRLADGKEVRFQPIPGGNTTVQLHPDGRTLIVNSLAGASRWPVEFTNGFVNLGPAESIKWQHVSDVAAAGPQNLSLIIHQGNLCVTDLDTQFQTRCFSSTFPFEFGALSPAARWCAGGNWKADVIHVYSVQEDRTVTSLPAAHMTVIRFSPDGRWLAAGGYHEYRLWQTSDWSLKWKIHRESTSYKRAVFGFAPDSSTLAIAFAPDVIKLIAPEDGREMATLEVNHNHNISGLAFSPNGQLLAVSRWNWPIELWDLQRIRGQLAELGLDW